MRVLCERLLLVTAFAVALPIVAEEVIRIPILAAHADLIFPVHYGDKWGYIDRTGKMVIAPQFDDEGDFFGGLAKVRLGDKWGYINNSGRLTIPYKFQAAGDFSEGLAPAMSARKWGFVNSGGRIVIRPQFQAASEFREGLSLFEIWDTIQCDGQSIYTKNNAPTYAFQLHLRN
ncbi:MAG: WG repeat-containing protein, partial [Bryobacteraceae bacterium]